MEEKTQTKQKGFIPISSLIAIIVAIVITTGIGAGVVLHKQGKLAPLFANVSQVFQGTEEPITEEPGAKEFEETRQEAEKERQEIEEANIEAEQLRAEQEEAQRITELEQRIKEIEEQTQIPSITIPEVEDQKNPEIITADDLDSIFHYVGAITCHGGQTTISGSASIWIVNWDWGKNLVLTNAHILSFPSLSWCLVSFDDYSGGLLGNYSLNIDQISSMSFNDFVDFAFLEIKSVAPVRGGGEFTSIPITSLSSDLELVPHCPQRMSLGSPVAVIGYPVTTMSQVEIEGRIFEDVSNKTVTTGIISSHDANPAINGYPDFDYFVSAKVDKGNSGGLAVSKHNGDLCILGIPTWVEKGYFENMGIIQSIHNIWNPK